MQYKTYHLAVYRDLDVIHTSGNEAYMARDLDVIHTSGNEAYQARDHDVFHTSGNEAYLTVKRTEGTSADSSGYETLRPSSC